MRWLREEESIARLAGVFLAGRNPLTAQAYGRDLAGFAVFVGAPTIGGGLGEEPQERMGPARRAGTCSAETGLET